MTEDWNPRLYLEHRNWETWNYFDEKKSYDNMGFITRGQYKVVKIPKGSQLKVDRIYIRKGVSDYNSVTFRWMNVPNQRTTLRFWVKLECANLIQFELEGKKV